MVALFKVSTGCNMHTSKNVVLSVVRPNILRSINSLLKIVIDKSHNQIANVFFSKSKITTYKKMHLLSATLTMLVL